MQKKVLTIFVLLVIAIAVVGYMFFLYVDSGREPVQEATPADEEKIVYPSITPDEVVAAFYNWYLEDGNALPSENFLDADSLTDNFKAKLSGHLDLLISEKPSSTSTDPILCSVEMPDKITTGPTQIADLIATVTVNEKFSEAEETSLLVELLLNNNAWKINDVLCFTKA